jgi:hypothetical protein
MRPAVIVRQQCSKTPPEHLESSVTNAMHRSAVTRSYLKDNLAEQGARFGARLARDNSDTLSQARGKILWQVPGLPLCHEYPNRHILVL